jgi:hypothetical protein
VSTVLSSVCFLIAGVTCLYTRRVGGRNVKVLRYDFLSSGGDIEPINEEKCFITLRDLCGYDINNTFRVRQLV